MRRVLITGMSGTGKSSALSQLTARGFDVVDTDDPGWTEWSDEDGGYLWVEDRMAALLDKPVSTGLFVSGATSNQVKFYSRFDAIVLLSAPVDVLAERIRTRTTNRYGKSAAEMEQIRRHVKDVEPLLRRACTHEIDAREPLAIVVNRLAELAGP